MSEIRLLDPNIAGLRVERQGPVGWLIFNRPTALNAMDVAMMGALPMAWKALAADDAVHAIVVTGTGRAFQTGLDMAQLSRDKAALREMARRTRAFELQITGLHMGVVKPVIAAVNGVCAGGGLHFVADADVVIASSRATFVDPHVSVGLVSALEPIGLIKKGVAFGDVMRMALTGSRERLSAQRAWQVGLVSEVVAPDLLKPTAQRLGEAFVRGASSRAQVKTSMWRVLQGRK